MTPQNADMAPCNGRVAQLHGGADNPAMKVVVGTVRAECAACGAHVEVRRGWQLAGQCGNCRSYDLRPLVPPRPPVALPARWAA